MTELAGKVALVTGGSGGIGPAQLLSDVEDALGPVDIVVANHGTATVAAYDQVDAPLFDRTVAINLRAPFLLAQAGRPEEVADLAVAVLRNGYVTSHVFSVDGGMHPG